MAAQHGRRRKGSGSFNVYFNYKLNICHKRTRRWPPQDVSSHEAADGLAAGALQSRFPLRPRLSRGYLRRSRKPAGDGWRIASAS